MMQSNGYDFTSAPRSVTNKRPTKGRDNGDKNQNIMFDRRVHRGSAYTHREESADKTDDKRSKTTAPKRTKPSKQQSDVSEMDQNRAATPPPVEGRYHMDIQTDTYLEELTDRNPEVDIETQTDPLLDLHPQIVSFVPMPSGIDVATQIENGDLFDFDLEVEPILEVLAGKTLEISMLEVLEENELQEIRHRQEVFEHARNAELAEVQRLEAEAKRKFAEKQRRVEEEQMRIKAQAEMEEKVAARNCAKQYLADLHSHVFSALVESGHYYDPIEKDVEEHFLPEVLESSARRVEQMALARNVLDNLLAELLVHSQANKL